MIVRIFCRFLSGQTGKRKEESVHEEVERQLESIELCDEATNGVERAKIESHDDDLRVRILGQDSRLGFLCSFKIPSWKNQSRAAPRQNLSRLGTDS